MRSSCYKFESIHMRLPKLFRMSYSRRDRVITNSGEDLRVSEFASRLTNKIRKIDMVYLELTIYLECCRFLTQLISSILLEIQRRGGQT